MIKDRDGEWKVKDLGHPGARAKERKKVEGKANRVYCLPAGSRLISTKMASTPCYLDKQEKSLLPQLAAHANINTRSGADRPHQVHSVCSSEALTQVLSWQ